MKPRKVACGLVLCVAALLAAPSIAVAKLPPGSTFEVCGNSGCEAIGQRKASVVQIRLIEPAIDHGSLPAPSTERAWVRVDLKLGPASPGMSLGSLNRAFPVVYAAGLLGVPRADNTYRWTRLESGNLSAYEGLARTVSPYPPESLAELTPTAVETVEVDSPGNTTSDPEGFPVWILLVIAAGVVPIGLVWLYRSSPTLTHRKAP